MALSANSVPSTLPEFAVPLDGALLFCSAQAITADGYANDENAIIDVGPGRVEGKLVLDISALDLSSGDETYRVILLGSNDSAFGNGNVDSLVAKDFAAATGGRLVPTICAATPAVPMTGKTCTRYVIPFTNLVGQYVFRYLKLYVDVGGTSPSITLDAFLTLDEC